MLFQKFQVAWLVLVGDRAYFSAFVSSVRGRVLEILGAKRLGP